MESILRSFPEYIKVKDLPNDDITYKVNHFHILSLRFSLIAYYNAFVFWLNVTYYTLFCLFLQIDVVTLLYEKGILVRK